MRLKTLVLISLSLNLWAAGAAAVNDFMRLDPSCVACVEIDDLLTKYSTSLTTQGQLEITYDIAKAIAKMTLHGKSPLEQKRAIYYALKGAAEVIDDDFDAETIVRLVDLRKQAPKSFDEVFWHFPIKTQKTIAHRMSDLRDSKVRPGISIPKARELE